MARENVHSKDELGDVDPQLVRMIKFALSPSEDEDDEDEKLIKLLKMDDIPEPPDFIRENVLKAYCKEFRYRILWTKFKDHLKGLVSDSN